MAAGVIILAVAVVSGLFGDEENSLLLFRKSVIQYLAIDLEVSNRKEVKPKMKQNIHPDYQETTITAPAAT